MTGYRSLNGQTIQPNDTKPGNTKKMKSWNKNYLDGETPKTIDWFKREETIEEIVYIPIIEEDASDEEVEEAIEDIVQELDTEEVIEVLEEVQ